MKVVVQRSLNSSVSVHNKVVGKIDKGLVVLVGFKYNDTIEDIKYIVNKIIHLRIFDDDNHIMNKSIADINGSVLSISQFTLYANTKKGNRPSYIEAMKSDNAKVLYELFNDEISRYVNVSKGIFQSDMEVNIVNDGPVTIVIESGDKNGEKNKL